MVLSVCGFGYSGSGAVWDLLKEYPNCKLIGEEKEFTMLYQPDGLEDLRYHIVDRPARFMSSDVAIGRFIKTVKLMDKNGWRENFNGQLLRLAESFVQQITQVKWKGYWNYDIDALHDNKLGYISYRLRRFYDSFARRHKLPEVKLVKRRDMYLSIEESGSEHFMTCARQYMDSLIQAAGYSAKDDLVVFNQLFPANCPSPYFDFFSQSKAILVIRDPRDVYIALKRVQDVGSQWFPHDNADDFIVYYRMMHRSLQSLQDENVLIIRFEDMIYQYDATRDKILDFCGLTGKSHSESRFFDPAVSIRNTMLYREYPEYKEDIKKIEESLSDFLYPFDVTIKIDHNEAF